MGLPSTAGIGYVYRIMFIITNYSYADRPGTYVKMPS